MDKNNDTLDTSEKITLGESRVMVKYNDDNTDKINKIRELSAQLINLLEDDFKKHEVFNPEIKRVYANAQTEIEGACMWAIKAVCK